MLLETSLQAQVLIPMACSLIFGLITGTLLILILVPVFYHMYGTVLIWLGMPLYKDEDFGDDDSPKSDKSILNADQDEPYPAALARTAGS